MLLSSCTLSCTRRRFVLRVLVMVLSLIVLQTEATILTQKNPDKIQSTSEASSKRTSYLKKSTVLTANVTTSIDGLILGPQTKTISMTANRGNVKIAIISSSDVLKYSNNVTNYIHKTSGYQTDDYTEMDLYFDWEKLLGPSIAYYQLKNLTTNIKLFDGSTVGTFNVVIVDEISSTVLGSSKAFHIGIEKEVLSLNDSYYPGEFLLVNSTVNEYGDYGDSGDDCHGDNVDDCFSRSDRDSIDDYFIVFEVQFSFIDDPYKFNMAQKKSYRRLRPDTTIDYLIDWNKPGKYQLVAFLPFSQVIKGISNVFEVKRNNNTTKTIVKTDATSYSPGQFINLTLTRSVGTPFTKYIAISLFHANTSRLEESNAKLFYFDRLEWKSSSVTMQFQPRIDFITRGSYKFVVHIDQNFYPFDVNRYRLGVSNVFRVKRPLITIRTAKREFLRGETVEYKVYNPYFPLEDPSRSGFVYGIIPWDFNENSSIYNINSVLPNQMAVGADAGLYRFALILYQRYFDPYIAPLSKSAFRVLENNFILWTDKRSYRNGETMVVSLSSSAKVPLLQHFFGFIFPALSTIIQGYIPMTNDSAPAAAVINTSSVVDWTKTSGDYRISVYYYSNNQRILATSESFEVIV